MASPEYNAFMRAYRKNHAVCPSCGSSYHTKTLAGYNLDLDNPDAYKDKNSCKCMDCGDTHIMDDRVPDKKVSSNTVF